MDLCKTCRKLVYRTDPCKGDGSKPCGRTDGGAKSTSQVVRMPPVVARMSDVEARVKSKKSTAARKDVRSPAPLERSPHDRNVQDDEVVRSSSRLKPDMAKARSPEAGTQAPPVDVPLNAKGQPRKRAPKGTFDRKAWQRDAARRRRAAKKSAAHTTQETPPPEAAAVSAGGTEPIGKSGSAATGTNSKDKP